MNLSDLRTEVLAHGFESAFFLDRVNQYLNDAYSLVCRRVDYYVDEAIQPYTTVAGTSNLALPADWARTRSVLDTENGGVLQVVTLGDIDRSTVVQGVPRFYAQDGRNLHLYPTPDAVYDLELRYWKMPTALALDADEPNLPADWHRMLIYWAIKECYASEDDSATAQYWEQQFNMTLAEFMADQRFPSTDTPSQAKSMWGDDPPLSAGGWRRFPEGL